MQQKQKSNASFSKWLWGSFTAIFIIVLSLLAFGYYNSISQPQAPLTNRQSSLESLAKLLQQKMPNFFQVIERVEKGAQRDIEMMIDKELENAFAPVYTAADSYVNFHYSLKGEYSQLYAYSKGSQNLNDLIYHHIFEKSNFDTRINEAMHNINTNSLQILQEYYERLQSGVKKQLQLDAMQTQTLFDQVLHLSKDDIAGRFMNSEAIAMRLVSTAGGAFAARGLAATIGARLAVRLGAKTGIRFLGAGAGASIGVLCGPAAAICGIGGAIAGWLSIDKAIIEIDQYYNQDEFRFELYFLISEEKRKLKKQLLNLYLSNAEVFKDSIVHKKDKTVIELMRKP
ncbi:MAG: hypothetical protein ACQESH_01435 [Campylobacterota bacterium]